MASYRFIICFCGCRSVCANKINVWEVIKGDGVGRCDRVGHTVSPEKVGRGCPTCMKWANKRKEVKTNG